MANQKGRTLNYMETHREGITQMAAFNVLGICRLSERIREIEACGIRIRHEWIEAKNRFGESCHVMNYRLM